MEPVIEVKNLKKRFGKIKAVDGISFEVEANEIFGLLGPNGSGKTTSQRMLCTVLDPTSGSIRYHGRPIKPVNVEAIRREIGYVPQGECLYGDLTIEENLRFFAKPYGLGSSKIEARITDLLKLLSLEDRKDELVKNLSGGLNKRASIAAALVHEPKILFLDEVTMGLDPNSRYHIWNLIRELKKHATIIITTHYMDEAEDLCDRIAILSKGKIMELDTPGKIIKRFNAKDLNEVIGKIIEEEK